MMDDADLTYLSLGAGVQSTALLICSTLGLLDVPRADVALFSDSGCEPRWVYRGLDLLEQWMGEQERPIPIRRITPPWPLLEMPDSYGVGVPAFVRGIGGRPGLLTRQCTGEMKVKPLRREVRRLLGYHPGQRVKGIVAALIGISWDERQRAKMARERWLANVYPFVELGIARDDCRGIMESAGLRVLGKSSCIVCPYHSDAYWRALRELEPDSWETACAHDERIREHPAINKGPVYLHRSLTPLRTVRLPDDAQLSLIDPPPPVCEGMCGL
jgi:hypothetical protein